MAGVRSEKGLLQDLLFTLVLDAGRHERLGHWISWIAIHLDSVSPRCVGPYSVVACCVVRCAILCALLRPLGSFLRTGPVCRSCWRLERRKDVKVRERVLFFNYFVICLWIPSKSNVERGHASSYYTSLVSLTSLIAYLQSVFQDVVSNKPHW